MNLDYKGIAVADPLAPGTGMDLMASFISGQTLDSKFAAMICDQVRTPKPSPPGTFRIVLIACLTLGAHVCHQAIRALEPLPNVSRMSAPTPDSPICIVGDLHGELKDLEQILEIHGPPGPKSRYVFNGDFVDRGTHGVEVLLVLLCLKILYPDYIHLNRGNHEDAAITAVYGFKGEATRKYSKPMFNTFVRIFQALPLCTLIGEELSADGSPLNHNCIFVVHGGICENKTVKIHHIEKVHRKNYPSVIAPKPRRKKATKEDCIIEDLTWSDPCPTKNGIVENERGSGICYGYDVTEKFLEANNCKTLIRSHECIEEGVEAHHLRNGMRLYTVFSSSNYSGGDNFAAVMRYNSLDGEPEVVKFRTMDPPPSSVVQAGNSIKLKDLVCRRHYRLLKSFQELDAGDTGFLELEVWQKSFEETLSFQGVDWSGLGLEIPKDGNKVNYKEFLKSHSVRTLTNNEEAPEEAQGAMSAVYENYDFLKAVFESWDVDHDGNVDEEEFKAAIGVMNEGNPDGEQLDAVELFRLLDFDHSGSIDINEICAASRMADQ